MRSITPRGDEPPEAVFAEFAARLRALRERAGNPSFRHMAQVAGYSHTALVQAVKGQTLPSEAIAVAFATACGAPGDDWRAIHRCHARRLIAARGRAPEPHDPCPTPEEVTDGTGLARAMYRFKLDSGLSYTEISRRSREHTESTHYANDTLPRQTMADFAGGKRIPHVDVLVVFLRTLGHPPEEIAAWARAHARARAARKTRPVMFEHHESQCAPRRNPVPPHACGTTLMATLSCLVRRLRRRPRRTPRK